MGKQQHMTHVVNLWRAARPALLSVSLAKDTWSFHRGTTFSLSHPTESEGGQPASALVSGMASVTLHSRVSAGTVKKEEICCHKSEMVRRSGMARLMRLMAGKVQPGTLIKTFLPSFFLPLISFQCELAS